MSGTESTQTHPFGLIRPEDIPPIEEPIHLKAAQKRILDAAKRSFKADAGVLFTVHPIRGELLEDPLSRGGALDGSVGELRSDNFARRALDNEFFVESGQDALSVGTLVGLAVREARRKKPLAILYLGYVEPRTFDADQKKALIKFARLASTSLQSTWLLRRYKQVARIGFEINRELRTIEDLFEKLAQKTPRLIDVPGLFCLAIYSWQRDEATFFRYWDGSTHPPQVLPVGGDLGAADHLVVATTAAEVADSPLAGHLTPADLSVEMRSSLSVPLQHRGHLLGYLFFQHPD
ncbi:MAG: hypothetical protein AAFY88_00570 [Acidobacteriota bacterium]